MMCAVFLSQNWKNLVKPEKQLVNDYVFSPDFASTYDYLIYEVYACIELLELWNYVLNYVLLLVEISYERSKVYNESIPAMWILFLGVHF